MIEKENIFFRKMFIVTEYAALSFYQIWPKVVWEVVHGWIRLPEQMQNT